MYSVPTVLYIGKQNTYFSTSSTVLLIGTNDLEEDADPETIAANLKLILAALKEHDPKMSVVLCQVFPSASL